MKLLNYYFSMCLSSKVAFHPLLILRMFLEILNIRWGWIAAWECFIIILPAPFCSLSLPLSLSLILLSHFLQEEDFHEMVRTSEVMENQYGHLFDKVIVNDDLSTAFNELRMVLRTVETETHWVPVGWNHSWKMEKTDKTMRVYHLWLVSVIKQETRWCYTTEQRYK